MTTRRRPVRPGFTLIELMLVIGGVSIILSLCGVLLHTLLRLDRAGRESVADATTLSRLAGRFRQDVRASREAEPGAPGSLKLTRPDGPVISYRGEKGRLLREERDGKSVVRREAYAVSRLTPWKFEVDGPIVRLVLPRRPANPHAPVRPAVGVEARLDKDRSPADRAEDRK